MGKILRGAGCERFRLALVVTIVLAAPVVRGADDDDDKLCEVIGEAPNLSVPPKDRLWFKENCTCAGTAGCGKLGSDRFSKRVSDAIKEVAAAKADSERSATAAKAAHEKFAKEAAKKKKRRADRVAQLRASILDGMAAAESQDARYDLCLRTTGAKMDDPEEFCHALESEFIHGPRGEAIYQAQMARDEAAEKKAEAEAIAKQQAEDEAQQLRRVRACCRGLQECIQTHETGMCAADRALLETACTYRQFQGDGEIAGVCRGRSACESVDN